MKAKKYELMRQNNSQLKKKTQNSTRMRLLFLTACHEIQELMNCDQLPSL